MRDSLSREAHIGSEVDAVVGLANVNIAELVLDGRVVGIQSAHEAKAEGGSLVLV